MSTGTTIHSLDALEILDSRGHPTLQVRVTLDGGVTATASVPAGRDHRRVHCRFRSGDGLRPDEVRRALPGRAAGKVQPPP
ncbi:hypothetical protein [Methylobacterium litchii]|uniref:hypothetical protein n=1 Tax=Methylobacterium litchii TaxID=3138810 RepID=UPI00399D4BA0